MFSTKLAIFPLFQSFSQSKSSFTLTLKIQCILAWLRGSESSAHAFAYSAMVKGHYADAAFQETTCREDSDITSISSRPS